MANTDSIVCIAVDQGNYNMKSFGPSKRCKPFPTGVNHHGEVPPPMLNGALHYKGKYYSICENRLQARRNKTSDEDYLILTLAAIARELREEWPEREKHECKVGLALGLPVEHLSLKVDGVLLKDKYKSFFGNNGLPLEFEYEGSPYRVQIVDVSVFPQTISAAASDAKVWQRVVTAPRSYIIDIGGGTTNVISIINGEPQNPGITLENAGVLQLFKDVERHVREDCGISLDDFMVDSILRGIQQCPNSIRQSICNAADEFVRKRINDLQDGRNVDMLMGQLCFVGGGSVLLFEVFQKFLKRDDLILIPDVCANAKGYYYQEVSKLNRNGRLVYYHA